MRLGLAGLGGAAVALAGTKLVGGPSAGASAAPSRLRTVLDRGKLIVGTGSTNAPWHFEDEKGKLTGMDIAMGRILAKGLFDDDNKVEFVIQDSAARIPNIVTGKVDITIQFMTVTAQRAQLAAFSRPYYVEGIALLAHKDGARKTFEEMLKAGAATKVSILQNADADNNVKTVLPQAQVLQIDTQANVIQALDSKRVDAAAVDLSNMAWLVRRHPDKYVDAGKHWQTQLYSAAMRQGDPDWLNFVNTVFNVAMHGNDTALYDAAFKEFFGVQLPGRVPGFPKI
jgi:polar amino acid transport system substrate-binding protein